MSATGGIVGIILFGINFLTRKHFSARWNYYMLLIPLLLMTIPFSFDIQLQTPKTIHSPTITAEPIQVQQPAVIVFDETVTQPQNIGPVINTNTKFDAQILINILPYIWLIGFLIIVCYKLFVLMKFKRTIRHSAIAPTDEQLLLLRTMFGRKNVRLETFDGIATPFIMGIFKPTIYIPNTKIADYNFSLVLKHELTHIKRFDLLYKAFVDFVSCVHFFNPIIYLIKRQMHNYCELSCDEAVAQGLDIQERKSYGKTILSFMQEDSFKLQSTTCLSESESIIKKRLELIMKTKKINKMTVLIGSVVVCALAIGGIVFASALNNKNAAELSATSDGRTNILIMGVDGQRSDSIMLLLLDHTNKSLSMLSIPRDTKVLSENGYDKISSLYNKTKTEQSTIEAVEQITGLPIKFYVALDYNGFRNIIDILGGVEIDVPNDMYYEDPYQNLKIAIPKGRQVLMGEDAEGFVRYRVGYSGGDLTRIKNQQVFIKELFKQKLNAENLMKLPDLYPQITEHVKTNYTLSDMKKHLSTIKSLTDEGIQAFSLPGTPGVDTDSIFYFIYNEDETQTLIREHFKDETQPLMLEPFKDDSNVNELEVSVKNITTAESETSYIDANYSAFLMNIDTGEIISQASAPRYSENQSDNKNTYEPGSTFKIITLAIALQEKVVTLDDIYDCTGSINIENINIRCHKAEGHGKQTVMQGIINGCYPMLCDIALKVGEDKFYSYMEALGITNNSTGGIFHEHKNFGKLESALTSIGQGFTVSPIQMATAYSKLLNGKSNIVSEETATQIKTFLSTLTSTTMTNDVSVGIINGIGEKLPRGSGKFVHSSIALAPAENPQVIAVAVLDEPKNNEDASTIALKMLDRFFPNKN
jgi:LCP family protein required for cell wall assembly